MTSYLLENCHRCIKELLTMMTMVGILEVNGYCGIMYFSYDFSLACSLISWALEGRKHEESYSGQIQLLEGSFAT